MKKKAAIITLGCSKNLVDSERLLYRLKQADYDVEHNGNYQNKDLVLVNTCGFIQDAKQESIDLLMDLIAAKKEGEIKEIRVFGCLSERYREELKKEIPEIDAYYGTYELEQIYKDLKLSFTKGDINNRELTSAKHYAYVKISDGCDRTCSFCAIPIIKGKHRSRPMESILAECNYLANKGVKEIILIAQDLSYYGLDIYKKNALADLLNEISKIESIVWVRMHYLYPNHFPYEVLDVMQNNPKVCNYMDIALQHISNHQLDVMRRNIDKESIESLINIMKKKVPNIAIRTTMLVGHPFETEQDFEELLDFVEDVKFDRLGAFTYSHEDNTYAFLNYEDNVAEDVKIQRLNQLMDLQQNISYQLNQDKIGNSYQVIIDREEEEYFVGRTEFDSPEVDNEVLIEKDKKIAVGEFYQIKITSSDDFDLYGKLQKV